MIFEPKLFYILKYQSLQFGVQRSCTSDRFLKRLDKNNCTTIDYLINHLSIPIFQHFRNKVLMVTIYINDRANYFYNDVNLILPCTNASLYFKTGMLLCS